MLKDKTICALSSKMLLISITGCGVVVVVILVGRIVGLEVVVVELVIS